MYTYRNRFHGTETQSKYSPGQIQTTVEHIYGCQDSRARDAILARHGLTNAPAAIRRMKRKLCGFSDCQCSGMTGIRH